MVCSPFDWKSCRASRCRSLDRDGGSQRGWGRASSRAAIHRRSSRGGCRPALRVPRLRPTRMETSTLRSPLVLDSMVASNFAFAGDTDSLLVLNVRVVTLSAVVDELAAGIEHGHNFLADVLEARSTRPVAGVGNRGPVYTDSRTPSKRSRTRSCSCIEPLSGRVVPSTPATTSSSTRRPALPSPRSLPIRRTRSTPRAERARRTESGRVPIGPHTANSSPRTVGNNSPSADAVCGADRRRLRSSITPHRSSFATDALLDAGSQY